jgi:hypothetical protein
MLELERLVSGQSKDIYVLVRDGRCEAKKCIEELDYAPRNALMATLQRMADTGWAGHGESRIGYLEGSRIACEFKERKTGTRLLFFMAGKRIVVCTHGGAHPGRPEYRAHIRKVERLREDCLREGILP